jgi:LmbE family N-acetylglucosaminyl deacetylase
MDSILILSPHTNDVKLGSGESIERFVEEGRKLFVAVFSSAEESLPEGIPKDVLRKEFFHSMKVMGIQENNLYVFKRPVRRLSQYRQNFLESLITLKKEIEPDLFIMLSSFEVYQDHQVVHNGGLRAFRNNSLLCYELPWNNLSFVAQGFFPLSHANHETKWLAMQSYKSQITIVRTCFSWDYIHSLVLLRGGQIRTKYAETLVLA